MGIRFQCHHCGHQLHVKDFQAGKKGRCPACQGSFRIPPSDAQYSSDASTESVVQPMESQSKLLAASQVKTSTGTPNASTEGRLDGLPNVDSSQDAALMLSAKRPQVDAEFNTYQLQPSVITEAPTATWYVRPASGGQFGPAPAAVFWQWLNENRVGHDSLVWRDDWKEWLPANQAFSEFFLATAVDRLPQSSSADGLSAVNLSGVHTIEPSVPLQPAAVWEANASTPAADTASRVGLTSRTTATSREMRKRSRRTQYAVTIAVLVVILISLAIGLTVVLYQQGVIGPTN